MTRFAILAALALTACGPMNQGGMGESAADAAKARVGSLLGRAPAPVAAPPAPPNIADAAPGDLLMVNIESRGAVAAMTRTASNNGTDTYQSSGNVAMTFRDGILVASRGLSEDLMGADIANTLDVLRAGGGITSRAHSFLNSEDQIRTRQLTCIITQQDPETITTIAGPQEARKYSEKCRSDLLTFTNTYWLDADTNQTIIQSRQALAPGVGFIQVNPL